MLCSLYPQILFFASLDARHFRNRFHPPFKRIIALRSIALIPVLSSSFYRSNDVCHAVTEQAREYISASDLDKYGYCPLSWWLSHEGVDGKGAKIKHGTESHRKIGKEFEEIMKKEERSKSSETIVISFAIGATLLSIAGLVLFQEPFDIAFSKAFNIVSLIWLIVATFFLARYESVEDVSSRLGYERLIMIFSMVATLLAIFSVLLQVPAEPQVTWALEFSALAWLMAASVFFYLTMRDAHAAKVKRELAKLDHGTIESVDSLDGKDDEFVSEKYGLRGRPDILLDIDGRKIPVEIKTGRIPRGPLFSHILQLAGYCLLVHEKTGAVPPYGILRYCEDVEQLERGYYVDHKIEYTEDLNNTVVSKLEEMRKTISSGVAHRNHNRVGKCTYCSRSNKCPERLG